MNKLNSVLREVLAEARPDEEKTGRIHSVLEEFLKSLRKEIKSEKVDAEVFVGGSFAKRTFVKKERYDIDIYVRFSGKYGGKDISEVVYNVLKNLKLKYKLERVHGSRDYFKVIPSEEFFFEIVPVMRISKPEEAENITDLSYYHVKYINKKIKGSLINEIILAKLFCKANRVYGAESHIKGFSGYSLELLILHYKSFVKFLKSVIKSGENKIIIDLEKHYKNRNQIMMDINSSKLASPIILIDPTYKQRNALATLSYETFSNFRKSAEKFLKNPSRDFFIKKEPDFDTLRRDAVSLKEEFLLVEAFTEKQEGAIAGSKLLKFYNYAFSEISKYFDVSKKDFYYDGGKSAKFYFTAKRKESVILKGPPENMKEPFKRFRNEHRNVFVKSGIAYAKEKVSFSLGDFMKRWINKNRKIIKEMYITRVKL